MIRLGGALFLLVLVAAGTGTAQEPPSSTTLFAEHLLCNYSGPQRTLKEETLRVSDDMNRVAVVIKKKDKHLVALNGKDGKPTMGKEFQEIFLPTALPSRDTIRFSPDWQKVGYAAKNEKGHYIVVTNDGKEEKESEPYEFMLEGMPLWSPDSKRYAFAAYKKGKIYVVTDKGIGPPIEDLQVGTLTWSPDSSMIAYSGREGNQWRVYGFDKAPKAAEQGVSESGLRFSPDSKHVAYAAIRSGRWQLMLDGELVIRVGGEKPGYEAVARGMPVWSEDSQHLAWAAQRGGKWWVIVNGKETGGPYDAIAENTPASLIWSKRSTELTYGALQGGRWKVFTQIPPPKDEKKGGKQETKEEKARYAAKEVASGSELLADTPRYSGDGSTLLYAIRNEGWRVYPCEAVNRPLGPGEKPELPPAYAAIKEGSLRITSDGSKVVFAARRGDRWVVNYNGKELTTGTGSTTEALKYEDIGRVVISRNDGTSTFAMAAKRRGAWLLIVNGEERYRWYNEFLQDALVVSRDGRRIGYYAVGAKDWALWVDGIPQICKVPYTYRFNPDTGLVEGVTRDRDSVVFHAIRETRQ